jgi:diacylglycerol kinase (ATP)
MRSRLGVVANARSWRNRDETDRAKPAADFLHAIPETLDDYPRVLREFADAGVGVLAVDGGDGTLRDVLSALPGAYGERLPSIALMPSGKTNVAALDVGHVGRGAGALARLAGRVTAGLPLETKTRRPIMVTTDGWTRAGFVFGLGAYERATRLVNERVHSRGFAQKLGVAMGVVGSVAAAFGKDREVWREGVPLTIAIDGGEERTAASFVALGTSLDRLILGLWPFWGAGEGAIRMTEIAAPPQRLASGLASIAMRRKPGFADEAGYRSFRADRVSLKLSDPFIFDGDTFAPGADGRVKLVAGPQIRFVRL